MQNVAPAVGMSTAPKQAMSSALRGRLVLISLPLLMLALIGGGIYGLQVASQRGLDLGYPTPNVHITSSIPSSVAVGQAVTFTADSPGRDLSYQWDFGDGSGAAGASVSHTYQQINQSNNNIYTVTVSVVDSIGRTSRDMANVKVLPIAPVANFTYMEQTDSFSGSPNQYVNFDASGSTIGTPGATYYWNFGDSNTDTMTVPTDQHYFYPPNTYTVTLYVVDDAGQTSNTVTQQVVVT